MTSVIILAESPLDLIQSILIEAFETENRQKSTAIFDILVDLAFLAKNSCFPPKVAEFLFSLFLSFYVSSSSSSFFDLKSIFRYNSKFSLKIDENGQKFESIRKTYPKIEKFAFWFNCDDSKKSCVKALCELRRYTQFPEITRQNISFLNFAVKIETIADCVFNSLVCYAKPKNEYGGRCECERNGLVKALLEWVVDEFGNPCVCLGGGNAFVEENKGLFWLCQFESSFKCCFKRIVVQNGFLFLILIFFLYI